jgi:hypothetical protein
MALNSDVAKALSYLRRRYKVSERDLVGLAKKFKSAEEPEETWEEITQRALRNRKGRFTSANRKKYR